MIEEEMEREPVHLSAAEATRDFAKILEQIERGADVIIENGQHPVALIRPVPQPGRLLAECIALAEAHGSGATLDGALGKDLEGVIRSHAEPLGGLKG